MKFSLSAVVLLACLVLAYSRNCEEADDCGADECCVAYTQLGLYGNGRCVRLGREGRRCNEPEASLDYYGGKFFSRCPCQEGLVCESRGERNSGSRLSRSLRQRCQRPSATTTTTSTTSSTTTTTESTLAPTTPTTTTTTVVG